jgi:hypothetical protein
MTSTETVRTKTMSSSYRPRPRPAETQAVAAAEVSVSKSTIPRIDTPPVLASKVLAPAQTIPASYRPRAQRAVAPATANATQNTAMVKPRSTLRKEVGPDQKALAAKFVMVSFALSFVNQEECLPGNYLPR